MAKKEERPQRIIRKDGKDCFLEVVDDAFEIGKFRFDFLKYDNSKEAGSKTTDFVSIYIDASELLLIADKVIVGGKEYHNYCEKNAAYKEPLYKVMGGTSAKTLDFRKQSRPDGKSLSRQFIISNSKKGLFFTAVSGPGHESETGLIVPEYKVNEAEQKVMIPFTVDDAKEVFLACRARYSAYLAAWYVQNPISARPKPGEEKKTPYQPNY